ncbi:MAG: hypothetical protein QGG36_02280 [Pirellulaceae bacterium]|nr:hypothetical protein [Pirellulaceae bacterium]MDP7014607.1 hypothetical protein [Pirellulaceae bacterium]
MRTSSIVLALIVCLSVAASGRPANGEEKEADFSGKWRTSFGVMTLEQEGDRVDGYYVMQGVRCLINGKVAGRTLTFKYREPMTAGEGTFKLSDDGKSFAGRWRQDGSPSFADWVGTRPEERPPTFAGLWNSTYGLMRLHVKGRRVQGVYSYGGGGTVNGELSEDGKTLKFRYRDEVSGSGAFKLSDDGARLDGKWAPDGATSQSDWRARKVEPVEGRRWLVVLEARWEANLTEREYSFGEMLRAFFDRAAHIQTRHRFFSNAESLQRRCQELAFLPEPAVLVIASHGDTKGLLVDGKLIPYSALIEGLQHAGDLDLIHFSSCQIMKGAGAEQFQEKLARPAPISGYQTSVDWALSAVLEFTYLDMIMVRGLTPPQAAAQLLKNVPIAGSRPIPGGVLPPAAFRLRMPPAAEKDEPQADEKKDKKKDDKKPEKSKPAAG